MNDRPRRWVWLDHVHEQVRSKRVGPDAGHIALVLVVHYANGKDEVWPTHKSIARSSGISVRAVQRGLDELVRLGLLNVRRGPPARTSGNVYSFAECGHTGHIRRPQRKERQSVKT